MAKHRSLFLVAALLVACHSRPTEHASAPSSRSLFDGRSLEGWDGDPRFWTVHDGAIVGRTTLENRLDAPTYLIWRGGIVADFELRCSFRMHGGNSGVQFRSRDLGGWKVAGYQADIEHPTWTGGLYEQDGRGVVATRGQHVVLQPAEKEVGALGDPAELLAHVHEHDWNEYTIRAVGNVIDLSINGVHTCEVIDRDPARRARSGILALQLHPGGPMEVEYRNLRLIDFGAGAVASDETPPSLTSSSVPRPQAAPVAPRKFVPSPGVPPQWIWTNDHPTDNERAAFSRHFGLREGITRATLRGAADNRMRVFVGGVLVVDAKDWASPVEVDVTKLVHAGDNEITIAAANEGSAAALWIELVVDAGDKRVLRLLSDGSWSATRLSEVGALEDWTPDQFDRLHASPSHAFGPFGIGPWGSLATAQNTSDPDERALPGTALQVPDGFRAELLYSVPKKEQGSWVTMCEDPRGRLYVCDQYGGLYRVTPAPSGVEANARVLVERVDVDLGSAHGLCWAFDSLYAVVAEGQHQHGLYRLRDTDGDDRLDSVELLREFEGGGEHGPHAVVLGPDEKLWIVAGNFTKIPEPLVSRVPRTWGEDELLPHLVDPNGHDPMQMAPGGWIARTDRDGRSWELWASGLRNAYDIAFNEDGELFTFDSDMEWDIGAPWYRPTRVLHVTSGAEFGWRNGSAKWPAYWPDTLPSACDVGLSSPTGLVFGTRAAFPARWRETLFACDWAYGTIYAVHLFANGSSYRGTCEPFVKGKPFPVTDAVIGRDGAMYITTGGRRTQSGLYRVSWIGDREQEHGGERILGRLERAERNRIAAWHDAPLAPLDAASLGEMVGAMRSADPFVARTARVALELRDPNTWKPALERESGSTQPRLLVQLLVAALHAAPKDMHDLVLAKLESIPLEKLDTDSRVDVLRLYQLALIRLAPLDEATLARFRARLEPMFPSTNERVDYALAPLLAVLQDPAAIEKILASLERAPTQEEKIHYVNCLRAMKSGWTLEQRKRFFALLDGDAKSFTGGLSLAKFVQNMRTEAIATLTDDERVGLAASLEPKSTSTGTVPAAARFVRNWKQEQLAPKLRDSLHGRSFDRGKAAFTKATCAQCHRIAVEGGATGPDLTGAGSRFSRADLLDAILEPSKTIPDQYQDTEVSTVDGDLFVGRIERDDGHTVTLRRFPPSEDVVEIASAEIESRRPYPLSRMPSGLLDVLDEDEILDLFAYVLAGGNPQDASFAR